MTAPVHAALAAASRGWCVFPLRPGDKRPAVPTHGAENCDGSDPWCRNGHTGWEQRATIDPNRIQRAWATTAYGVGIACGPSGLVVIDLDTPKPSQALPPEWQTSGVVDGYDVLAVLCERAGQPLVQLLDTYTVATPSGGTHLYYRHPDAGPRLRNTTGLLGPFVDTRAHGGYVVAAGTTIAGRPYRITCDTEPAPLPAWLAEKLAPRPTPPQQPVRIDLPPDRRGRYLHAAITRQLTYIATAPKGTRNNALYLSAVALGQLVAGGALPEADVVALLTRAGLDAGLRPKEVTRTIASGLKDGAMRPRSVAA